MPHSNSTGVTLIPSKILYYKKMYCRLRTFSKLTFVQPRIYTNTTTFFNPIQRSRWSFSTTSSEESHHDKAKKISEIVRVVGARIDSEKMIPKYNELSKAIQVSFRLNYLPIKRQRIFGQMRTKLPNS